MKKLLIIILGLIGVAQAQTVGQFRYDTTKFLKSPGFNEVKIQNSTMDSLGIAVNKGKGWLQWERPKAVPGGIKIGNDTILISADDTTGIGDLFIRNLTTQENKRFNVKGGRLDSLYASTSGGGKVVSNGGTIAAEWGAGGGSNFDFHGFAGYNLNRASSYTARSFTDKNYVDSSLTLKTTVSSYGKNAGGDSTILVLSNGTRFAAKDSIGGGGGSGWSLTGNASAVTDFLGTTNNRTMRFRTNNTERMTIDSIGNVGIGGSVVIGTPTNQGYKFEVNGSSQFNTGAGGRFRFETVGGFINQLFSTAWFNIVGTAPTAISGSPLYLGYNLNTAAINSTIVGSGNTPNASSIFEIFSTTKGFLMPRMTLTQRNAIASPAAGLQIFSTTDSTNYIYRGTTSGWQATITGIRGSATLDFGSIAHHSEEVLTFTVTGAVEGDVVSLGVPNASNLTNVIYTAWVSAANTVSVKCSNLDQSGSVNPASGTFKVTVLK
jgi:hypothetical protein